MKETALEKLRLIYIPARPRSLRDFLHLSPRSALEEMGDSRDVSPAFPLTGNQNTVHFEVNGSLAPTTPLRVGVVLSGGQAAGGHNVIAGLFDGLEAKHPGSTLIGFLNGPNGIVGGEWKELDRETIAAYRNMGGFDMIGSGRTKIESPEQFASARETVQALELDGLVVIGGDDSNTNAAFLAEDFKAHDLKTVVAGIPKTIDGDLRNKWVETSFGFDTACKTFSETIGNIARDTLSARKYYHFIKLMGRSASHITLECALQIQPNHTIISEEVAAKGLSLADITNDLCDVICERAAIGKDYGIVLIPEGLLEFIPECKELIQELNLLLAEGSQAALQDHGKNNTELVASHLSPKSRRCYQLLPADIQLQLILDRDPHGNVQVSKIETERLLIELVKNELLDRKKTGRYQGRFSAQPHFCGYEGRSCYPSNFDANYCYALGLVSVLLISGRLTGYMACVRNLAAPAEEWGICGVPLSKMMHEEVRKGKTKLVIKKTLVDLKGAVFQAFLERRNKWRTGDHFLYPGPIQFFGPTLLTDTQTNTLVMERRT